MSLKKKTTDTKSRLHSRNKHRSRYDFAKLIEKLPELGECVQPNKYGDQSINFFDPRAVKLLNTALLRYYYNIDFWEIPESYLCPPIPGRADYIHHIADLLAKNNEGIIPNGSTITCLDVGVGANCVYPIIGTEEYGWSFIGSDIDPTAIENATQIVDKNLNLKSLVDIRLQNNSKDIFFGVIKKGEFIDISICNPPFHRSEADAAASTMRKVSNLKKEKVYAPVKNFGGINSELWTEGGEERFIKDMIRQSKRFAESCFWFSTLVSKQSHLKNIFHQLRQVHAIKVESIPMGQGNKSSRVIVWTFLSKENQKKWREKRWIKSDT